MFRRNAGTLAGKPAFLQAFILRSAGIPGSMLRRLASRLPPKAKRALEPLYYRLRYVRERAARLRHAGPMAAIGRATEAETNLGVERIRELVSTRDYTAIAAALNEEGYRTAKGLEYDMYSVGYVARSRGWGRSTARRTEGHV